MQAGWYGRQKRVEWAVFILLRCRMAINRLRRSADRTGHISMIMNGNGRLSECEEDRDDDTEMDGELDRGQRTHYPTFALPSEGGDVG